MGISFTLQGMFRPRRTRAEAQRMIAARPAIPRPRTARRQVERSTPPVTGFVGELLWAVALMLMLALSVRVMFVFAALQGATPAVHVDETVAAAQPADRDTGSRGQPSSDTASRTM